MSRFTQIMHKGQRRVHFSPRKAALLMTLSAQQHRIIAQLISAWLDSKPDETKPGKPDR